MPHRYRCLRVIVVALTLASCARGARSPDGMTGDPRVDPDLARLRAATRAYQDLDAAVATGYPRTVSDCLVHEHHGAMGYHHVNRGYLTATPTMDRPPILLYERTSDGAYRLNGVEFIIPYRLYPRDSVPPVLLGQRLHHEDNLKFWYLHVWAWTNNADGLFANFNPAVTCPGGGGKVYKPFSLDAG